MINKTPYRYVNYVTYLNNCITLLVQLILPFQKIIYKNEKMKKAGIFLIIIGLILTVFTAVTFFTKEKVVDIGEVVITRNKPHHFNWSPLIGIGVMGLGGVVLLASFKK
jgi:hypothetical protein